MKVELVANRVGTPTGLGRYAVNLYQRLGEMGVDVSVVEPKPVNFPEPLRDLAIKSGLDVSRFTSTYPFRIDLACDGVKHLTSQNLATLLWFRNLSPVIVTVHDIIPYLLRNNRSLSSYRHPLHRIFDSLAVAALKKSDFIITDSAYSGRVLVDSLAYPHDRVGVVHLGVDHDTFKPLDVPSDFREKYGLSSDLRYIIYVGSEDPRKNLGALLSAFSSLRRERKDVRLIKIGVAHFAKERHRLLSLITELGIEEDVAFVGEVPEAELPLFYNVADISVLPSLYEGFGLPALEAMACGTPVLASNRTAVPEVVGCGGVIADPENVKEWTAHMRCILEDPLTAQGLKDRALRRAAEFSWGKTAEQTMDVYRRMNS